MRRSEALYWIERARTGDPCPHPDKPGMCAGCSKPLDRCVENMYEGCEVCRVWIEGGYMKCFDDDATHSLPEGDAE